MPTFYERRFDAPWSAKGCACALTKIFASAVIALALWWLLV